MTEKTNHVQDALDYALDDTINDAQSLLNQLNNDQYYYFPDLIEQAEALIDAFLEIKEARDTQSVCN